MRTLDRAKRAPEIGHSSERLVEDRKMKPKFKVQAGTAICERCKAVGLDKHWFFDTKLAEHYAADPLVRMVVCPGCKRVEDKMYEGEVTLESPLLSENKEMVYGTIYHTAAKAFHDNPFARIAVIEDMGDKIRLVTTTRWLAQRLGKEFHKAFKGHLEIKPSPGEKFVIVKWHRHEIT